MKNAAQDPYAYINYLSAVNAWVSCNADSCPLCELLHITKNVLSVAQDLRYYFGGDTKSLVHSDKFLLFFTQKHVTTLLYFIYITMLSVVWLQSIKWLGEKLQMGNNMDGIDILS